MNLEIHAPAVRTRSRTRDSDHERARRIVTALHSARVGTRRLLPVYYLGRRIAWIASSFTHYVVIEHHPWMDKHIDPIGRLWGISSIDDIIKEATQNGKQKLTPWQKVIYNGGLSTPRWHHLHGVAGIQGANAFAGTARTSRRHSDALDMAIDHGGNVSTDVKMMTDIAGRIGSSGITTEACTLMLYDLVTSVDQCDFNVASQNVTTTSGSGDALRYVSAGDPGMDIMPMTTAINGNTGYTALTYTSDTGTVPEGAAAVTSGLQTVFTSAAPGAGDQWLSAIEYSGSISMLSIPLRAGDNGVKQIDTYTMSATVAGGIAFLLGAPICWVPIHMGDTTFALDLVKQTGEGPVVLDGACLTWAVHSVSLSGNISGHANFVWGPP